MPYLVRFAYFLQNWKFYNKIKEASYNLLENQSFKYRKLVDYTMIFLILSTVAIIIYDTKNDVPPLFILYDDIVLGIFVLEYIIRLWICSDSKGIIIRDYNKSEFLGKEYSSFLSIKSLLKEKILYAITPLAIIDLLSILPGYRFLKVFRIFRIFKILRYTKSINQFTNILKERKFEFIILFSLSALMVFISSSVIYVAEAMDDRSKVNTFFDAIYWSVITIATVGYGDIVPVTFEGKAVALLLVVSSLGIIAFSTSIFTTSFTQKMFELKKNRDLGKIKNLKNYCVICGYGKIGQIVAQRLIESGDNVVVIDKDHTKIELARLKNIIALHLDATKSETLVSIGVGSQNISSILCLTDSESVNLYISLGVRYLNKDVMVVASIDNKSTYKKFLLAGVNHIIYPYEAMAKMGIEYMNNPIAYEALYTTLFGKEDAFLEEVYVKKGTFLDGKKISSINFKSYKLIVFGVLRDKDFTFNPSKNFVLTHGDKLMLIGYKESIEYFNTLVRR